jgi:hypothetical protein
VAHSQGAVVTHYCLRSFRPDNLRSFITLGSGLGKLSEIRTLRDEPAELRNFGRLEYWAPTACVLLASASFLVRPFFEAPVQTVLGFFMGASLVGLYMTLLFQIPGMLRDVDPEEEERHQHSQLRLPGAGNSQADFRWVDFYASCDPVSNGPLFRETPDWLASNRTSNRCSILSDHSGYFRNVEGFLGPLALELSRAADDVLGRELLSRTSEVLANFHRRTWRFRWLVAARWLVLVAGTCGMVGLWPSLERGARQVLDDLPDWITEPIGKLVGGAIGASSSILAQKFHVDGKELSTAAVAVLIAVVTSLAGYLLVYRAWRLWERRDIRRLIRRFDVDLGGASIFGFLVVLAVVCGVFVAAGIIAFDAGPKHGWKAVVESAHTTGQFLLWLGGRTIFVSYFPVLVISSLTLRNYNVKLAPDRRPNWPRAQTMTLTVIGVALLVTLRPEWFRYTPFDLMLSLLNLIDQISSMPLGPLLRSLIFQVALSFLMLGVSCLAVQLLRPVCAHIGDKLVARSTGRSQGDSAAETDAAPSTPSSPGGDDRPLPDLPELARSDQG